MSRPASPRVARLSSLPHCPTSQKARLGKRNQLIAGRPAQRRTAKVAAADRLAQDKPGRGTGPAFENSYASTFLNN